MAKISSIWKGEALKARRKTLGAINARMLRGNISTIGLLSLSRHDTARKMAAAYAEAMGWDVDRAAATIQAHEEHLAAFDARKY